MNVVESLNASCPLNVSLLGWNSNTRYGIFSLSSFKMVLTLKLLSIKVSFSALSDLTLQFCRYHVAYSSDRCRLIYELMQWIVCSFTFLPQGGSTVRPSYDEQQVGLWNIEPHSYCGCWREARLNICRNSEMKYKPLTLSTYGPLNKAHASYIFMWFVFVFSDGYRRVTCKF